MTVNSSVWAPVLGNGCRLCFEAVVCPPVVVRCLSVWGWVVVVVWVPFFFGGGPHGGGGGLGGPWGLWGGLGGALGGALGMPWGGGEGA